MREARKLHTISALNQFDTMEGLSQKGLLMFLGSSGMIKFDPTKNRYIQTTKDIKTPEKIGGARAGLRDS